MHYQLTPSDEFLILACDGVWDVLSSECAVDIVRERLITRGVSCKEAAQELVQMAYRRGSTDNITAIVIRFAPAGS